MKCQNCGVMLPEEAQFCPFCGSKQAATESVETEAPEQQSDKASYVFVEPRTNSEGAEIAWRELSASDANAYGNTYPDEYPNASQAAPEMMQETPADENSYNYSSQEHQAQQIPPQQTLQTPVAPKKKRKKALIIIGGVAVVLTVLAAILIPYSIRKNKQSKYDEGLAFLEAGNYKQAEEIFLSLDDFSDAGDKRKLALNGMEYDKAVKIMKEENYGEAKEMLLGLGNFKDSATLAKKCQEALDYESAVALYQEGKYAEAEPLLLKLGNYRDAKELALDSGAQLSYAEAKALMEKGEYDSAKEILLTLDSNSFEDRDTLVEECQNMNLYLAAKETLDAGEFYDAYMSFKALGDFKDSKRLAQDCIVPMPDTGETYRNSSYLDDDCELILKPPVDDGSCTYAKIYTLDNRLVSCLFINAGDEVSVELPAGLYRIKTAYGFGYWFGEKDMFGDEGVYEILRINFENRIEEIFDFEVDYIYTITLRTGYVDDEEDPIETITEPRDNF